ncbi:MAG: L-serine ammonia-lyase, iron-sulfur-dependent, subunit alpha [Oscillospiraceae bacterium]|nr:L-serine ammonia-lyase, iron-sulfur-dependent, subunit alpha [Oscillospiraceae bacterium]
MSFRAIDEILQTCQQRQLPFWQVVLEADAEEQGILIDQSLRKMHHIWDVMKDSIESYDPDMRSLSGMVGGEGGKMAAYAAQGDTLCGPFVSQVIARALMMGCSNACMRRIVTAPTAGACGVLPAVLYTCWKEGQCPEEQILHALYVAAGVGQVIAERASISGAAGGCQAEIGSASGMAAAALVSLRGGTPQQMADACAMALKNLMGLVCDPVGGLVEVPCVKRNTVGAVNALAAADMALAGISSVIPVDQVIDAMREVGDSMDLSLKETARGGIAISPRAKELINECRAL